MAEEVPDTQRTTSPAELRLPQGIEFHGAATVMPCETKIYYTRARSSGESLLRFQLSFVQREWGGEGRVSDPDGVGGAGVPLRRHLAG